MFASILLVILGVEVVVMIGLSALPAIAPLVAVFVDALLLAILSAPLLWLLVAKPLALSAEAEKLRLGARIASILQTSVDGILTTDGRGIISQFNVGAEKIFGYAAREAVGQHLSVLFPEHASGADREGVALRQGRRKNGEIFPAEATVSTLDDGHDVIRTAVVRDSTERLRAQQTLQDSESRLRQAQQIAGIGNWELDLTTNHLWWSEEIFRIFELDSTRFGASYEAFLDAIHPDDRDRVAAAYTGSLENRTPYEIGHRLRMADGRIKFVEERCETDYASDGTPQRSRGTLQDVTERILAGESLRVQSAALNAAANAIVITDRNGTFEWVNPAFTTLTGYRAEEAIGKNLRELSWSGVHDPLFFRNLWDTILAGEVWRGEMTNRHKDGRLYSVHQTITPVRDDRGEITQFIAIQRDLTDEKRLEAQFLQAQKMEIVGQLASGIAHDFNNLLTVINGTAELALRELGEDDPLRADFLQIHGAGDRAASLTRQLLAFGRRQILKPDVLNLSSLVTDLQGMLQRLIGEDVALVVVPAKDVDSVVADPGQIEQVVMNLVVNARDAMTDGGTLTIETRNVALNEAFAAEHASMQSGPQVMLAISDTGTGMDEATRTQIFEPFFTTKALGKGTGLGLSSVYGIVRQSGGSIEVISELGKGTTFKIYLPRAEAVASEVASAPTVPSVHGVETILVVEDEEAVCRLAQHVLELDGYTVLTASNGGEALALLGRHDGPVHLVLTDMVMPGMTGRELARQLKDIHPQTKVLFTSGYTNHAGLHDGLLDKDTHFIGKPYGVAQLTQKVREALDS